MEEVIETYLHPLCKDHPVVCFDESPLQLLRKVREPIDAAPRRSRREDYEYELCGVAEVMMICQPAAGQHQMHGDGLSQENRFRRRVQGD